MNFHSRLVGALDALLLALAALLMFALLLALMNPLEASGRAATLGFQSLPVGAEHAMA